MTEYVLADVAAGWLLWAIPGVLIVAFLLISAGEALVMKIMDWGTYGRSFLDALLVNLVSTIPGIVVAQYFPSMEFVGFLAAFAVTLLIEGGILALLRRHPASRAMMVALAANLASYLVLALIYFAD